MSDQRNNAVIDVGANDIDYKKAIGADDGGLVDTAVNAIKGVAGKLADKLDPLTEQYAGLFKTGLRTPVMRKPSDYGMDFEETWFPAMDGVPLEAWFIPAASDRSTYQLAMQLEDPELTPAAAATRREMTRLVEQALGQLGEQDCEIIILRHYEQLSNREVAEVLGLSEPAASMRYLRAVRRLRALLLEPSRAGPAPADGSDSP